LENLSKTDTTLSGFIVLGVPRSGTTLFARLLNNHPSILCGMERFHAHKLSPAHLTLTGFSSLDMERKSVAQNAETLALKDKMPELIIGEKCPRAYMQFNSMLPRFRKAQKKLKMIVLIRDAYEIENSWYRRAANKDDKDWHRGQFGVFPYLEQVLLAGQLSRLSDPEDVLLVSYAELLSKNGRKPVLDAVAKHLGVEDSTPLLAQMEADNWKTQKSLSRQRIQHEFEFATSAAFFKDFASLIDQCGTLNLADKQSVIRNLFDSHMKHGAFGDQVIDHIRNTTHSDIRAYQNKNANFYFNTVRKLDPKLAVRLRDVMKGEGISNSDSAMIAKKPSATEAIEPNKVVTKPSESVRYFDITDAVKFVAKHGGVTGIQRVQVELILAISGSEPHDAYFGIFLDVNSSWRVVPLPILNELFQENVGLKEALHTFDANASNLETPVFNHGDIIYFVGATWSISALFEALVEPRKNGVSTVFYMHDVLPLQRPDCFPVEHYGLFSNWLHVCLSNADAIVCNSDETKAGLLEHTGFTGPVGVANLNVFPNFIQEYRDKAPSTKNDIIAPLGVADSEYALMVGTIEPRKNYVTAFTAWIALKRALGHGCPKLIIVGKIGWLSSGVMGLLEGGRYDDIIVLLKDVTDQQLAALYDNALFTLNISYAEGWGLPLTESLASGTVSICGRGSAAQDAMQGLVVLVDQRSERDIVDTIIELLNDRTELAQIRERVRTQAQFKTWYDLSVELRAIEADLSPDAGLVFPMIKPQQVYNFGTASSPDLKSLEPIGLQLKSGIGWNAPDTWGMWSRRAEAALTFRLPDTEKYCLYAIVTSSLLHEELVLSARVNGGGTWHGKSYPRRRSLVILDVASPQVGHPIEVQFTSGEPFDFSRSDFSEDIRKMGFALIEMRVVLTSDVSGRLRAMEKMVSQYLNT
jgi:glycosyltransferase involved in cell wall biosynthesis